MTGFELTPRHSQFAREARAGQGEVIGPVQNSIQAVPIPLGAVPS